MTSCTIFANRLLVNIKVTGYATCFCLGKFQGGMALPAVNDFVLALQFKVCGVVIKENGVLVDYPAIRCVTGIAIDL
jgi:hypothetical protein